MKILRICRQGGDATVFENKEELRKQLCDFHSIDWDSKTDINSLSLEEIITHGDWDYKKITDEEAKEIDEGWLPLQSKEYAHA